MVKQKTKFVINPVGWIEIKEAYKMGRVLNRWGSPCSLRRYYQLIESGDLRTMVIENKTYVLC